MTEPFDAPSFDRVNDDDPEDGLLLFDPARCRCYTGSCTNRATTTEGLCDRCLMEYAALRNTHRDSNEWV